MWQKLFFVGVVCLLGRGSSGNAEDLTQGLTFYCSFDRTVDAEFAKGDRRAYTASSAARQQVDVGVSVSSLQIADGGKFGGCLRFGPKTERVLMYRGAENLPSTDQPFDLTVSMWMRLDPNRGLAPGFVDPLQITDKAWNNSSIFLDFTKDDSPRKFRLGVFAEYTFWNPEDTPWYSIAESARPMVTVDRPNFGADRWTHVAFVLRGVNGEEKGEAKLYLDGQLQGTLLREQRFRWNADQLAIMLGIYYTGDIDELAIWERALDDVEITRLQDGPLK